MPPSAASLRLGSVGISSVTRRYVSVVALPRRQQSIPQARRGGIRTITTQPKFSDGADQQALEQKLQPLLERWRLTESGDGLEREFKFKNFTKTWDFMTSVALQCKLQNHHPEWSNVYSSVFIRWTTHRPQGLSAKDVELAAICDRVAGDFGELVDEQEGREDTSCRMRSLADSATKGAGDCCTPKKTT